MTWLTDPRDHHLGGVVRMRPGLGTGTFTVKKTAVDVINLPTREHIYVQAHRQVGKWECPYCAVGFATTDELAKHWDEEHA